MTQEQKARAYDEALERAKAHINSKGIGDTVDLCKYLFPELAESEDERIMSRIIDGFKNFSRSASKWNNIPVEEVIAYLEKQKERGPLTKEEEYILHRIIEYLEDETCPSEWVSLLHDIYCLPYKKYEERKEQKPLKVGENAYFDPNTEMWFIKKGQKLAEDKELLKNILFQKKGITYDDYECKNNPYVGLYFDELIKCLEEYDKARSNR